MPRNKVLLLLACAGYIFPHSAFPIGRTGSGTIGDLTQGYSTMVPQDFDEITLANQGAVTLNSNYMLSPEFGGTEFIQARPFAQAYPQLTSGNENSVLTYFQATSGNYQTVQTSNCALSLLGEGTNTWVGISTWGNGNGFVALSAAKTDEAKQAILNMLQNTEITTPCWK